MQCTKLYKDYEDVSCLNELPEHHLIIKSIGVLLGVLGGAVAPQAVGDVGNFRLSEILSRRSEIFIYKSALFHMKMSLSGLCHHSVK